MSEFREIDGFTIEYPNDGSSDILSIKWENQTIKLAQKVEGNGIVSKSSNHNQSATLKGTWGIVTRILLSSKRRGKTDPNRIKLKVHFVGYTCHLWMELEELVIEEGKTSAIEVINGLQVEFVKKIDSITFDSQRIEVGQTVQAVTYLPNTIGHITELRLSDIGGTEPEDQFIIRVCFRDDDPGLWVQLKDLVIEEEKK